LSPDLPFGRPETTGTPSPNAFRFTDRENDAKGLYYYRARYYDPTRSRFVSEDPMGFGGGDVNTFAYVGQNPSNWIDAAGLWKSRGHRQLTLGSLPSGHFSKGGIERLVAANIGVDIVNPFPGSAHSMPGAGQSAEQLIDRLLSAAVQYELLGQHDAALYALGAGLHTLQDSYAHCKQDAGWWAHAPGGTRPDDPALHPDEFALAQAASTQFVKSFVERVARQRLR
jgi:RHS repeat-associated protein